MAIPSVPVLEFNRAAHQDYSGYAAAQAAWATHRANLLAAANALLTVKGSNINPAGAMELHKLIEAIDRNDALYR